jgi:NADPH-dependent 2,4-dienoyl-CoA reductase/sulfur reductase-like enzyme
VDSIDALARRVSLDDGTNMAFDKLLIATGADPVKLPLPGADRQHVYYLRTLGDSRAIIAAATTAKRALVMGASFIGLEVAASLRARGLEVTVVAPEERPLERVLGAQVGDFIKRLHEQHGVVFRLGKTGKAIESDHVVLSDGESIAADLVVIGVGVRPNIALAEGAGLDVDKGIVVNDELETSVPGIFAAGDVARYPDTRSGKAIRVEHWVHAQRMAQTAARNLLGRHEKFDAVPFFWSQHYDVVIAYVGHAESLDSIEIKGDLDAHDAAIAYRSGGRIAAFASIFRDRDSLEAEVAMERGDELALETIVQR